MTREMGKPCKESSHEVDWSIHSLRHSAEMGRNEQGRVMRPAVAGQLHYTLKQPCGTAALIMPFSYPMVLLRWEAGAAPATGNAVILRPLEYTTLTELLFAEATKRLPEDLYQIVTCRRLVGQPLVEHFDTHVVVFTASVPVGRAVARACGERLKPSLTETSGNGPFRIMPSALRRFQPV